MFRLLPNCIFLMLEARATQRVRGSSKLVAIEDRKGKCKGKSKSKKSNPSTSTSTSTGKSSSNRVCSFFTRSVDVNLGQTLSLTTPKSIPKREGVLIVVVRNISTGNVLIPRRITNPLKVKAKVRKPHRKESRTNQLCLRYQVKINRVLLNLRSPKQRLPKMFL